MNKRRIQCKNPFT